MEISPAPAPPALDLPLQQHPSFARMLGPRCTSYGIYDQGSAVGHVQLIRRGRLWLASRGPVWLDPGAQTAGMRALRRHLPGWSGLVINAETPVKDGWQAGFVRLSTGLTVAEWQLGAVAQMRAALHPKWRNRLVRAENAGLRVIQSTLPADPAHWLLANDGTQQRAKCYRAWPASLCAAYARANPDQAQLWTADRGDGPLAAVLVLIHGTVASYQIGWSGAAGRAAHAHNLLLWRAACWLADQGVRRFDLGSVDSKSTPGLAHFKLGTGAAMRTLGGTWATLC